MFYIRGSRYLIRDINFNKKEIVMEINILWKVYLIYNLITLSMLVCNLLVDTLGKFLVWGDTALTWKEKKKQLFKCYKQISISTQIGILIKKKKFSI